jgi:hypothetical protein
MRRQRRVVLVLVSVLMLVQVLMLTVGPDRHWRVLNERA